MPQTLKIRIRLLINLMGYVLRTRPDAAFATLIGIFSTVLEVMSLAVLVPLTRIAANIPIQPNSPWNRVAGMLGQHPTARFYVIAFFALMFIRAATLLGTTILVNRVTRGINAIFSVRALEAFVHHLRFSQVQKESIGHFVSVAGDEAFRASMIASSVMRFIPLLLLFVLYLVLISYQSWPTGVGFVFFCLVVLICLLGAFRKALVLGDHQQQLSREAGTHFIESLSGLRTVRSFNAESYVTGRYQKLMNAYMHSLFLGDMLNAIGGAVPTLFLTAGMLVALAFFIPPAHLVLILPAIVVGIMMVLRLLPLATQTLDVAMRLTSDLKAAENISEMLAAVKSADRADREEHAMVNRPITRIDFDGVSFRYDQSLPPVLEDFSISLTAGKSYAISGPSGAGKSTIVDLLLKFYSPQSGTIRVNGKDIQGLSNDSLRRRVVLAEQTVRIFYDTIEHNVQFGRGASSRDVAEALDMVGLRGFLDDLPDGQRTLLNYQGGNVSGGQRQRIGLARALLVHADVLIMDESTSALDHATRERILSQILPRFRDRILIFIAHDPTILALVDEVIYLQQEQLSELPQLPETVPT